MITTRRVITPSTISVNGPRGRKAACVLERAIEPCAVAFKADLVSKDFVRNFRRAGSWRGRQHRYWVRRERFYQGPASAHSERSSKGDARDCPLGGGVRIDREAAHVSLRYGECPAPADNLYLCEEIRFNPALATVHDRARKDRRAPKPGRSLPTDRICRTSASTGFFRRYHRGSVLLLRPAFGVRPGMD